MSPFYATISKARFGWNAEISERHPIVGPGAGELGPPFEFSFDRGVRWRLTQRGIERAARRVIARLEAEQAREDAAYEVTS